MATSTATSSPTSSSSATATSTATNSLTSSSSATATSTATNSLTSSSSATATATSSSVVTATPTSTSLPSASAFSSPSPSTSSSTRASLSPTASTSGTAHPTLTTTSTTTATATGTATNTSYLNITYPFYNKPPPTTDPIDQNGYIGIGIGSTVAFLGTLVGLSHVYKSYKLKLKRLEETTPVIRENPINERLQIRYVEKGTNTPPLTPRNSGDSFEPLDLNDSQ